jgi:hypothetical protein
LLQYRNSTISAAYRAIGLHLERLLYYLETFGHMLAYTCGFLLIVDLKNLRQKKPNLTMKVGLKSNYNQFYETNDVKNNVFQNVLYLVID